MRTVTFPYWNYWKFRAFIQGYYYHHWEFQKYLIFRSDYLSGKYPDAGKD